MKMLLLIPLKIFRLLIQSTLLALNQIWVNKTRSILTTVGIIIGVASVSAVIAAMDGMNNKIMENFETFGTKKIFLWPERPSSGPKKNVDWWQIRFKQEEFNGMLEYCPSVESKSFISDGRNLPARFEETSVESVRLNGVEASWFEIENREIIMGRPFSHLDEKQGRKVCIISKGLRDKLQMDQECTGQAITFGYHTFLVIGLLEEKPSMMFDNSNRDNLEAYIPFRTMRKISNNEWFRVMANCKSTDLAEEAKAEIKFFLRRTRHIRPGEPDTFNVFVMENEVKQVMGVLGMISGVAYAIVSISLLVGGVGIMNIMLVSVSERTREIGLRKAVGAKPSAILTQFLVEAVVLCLFGGLIGLSIGHLSTMLISKFPLMEGTRIPFWAILLSFGFSGGVGVVFGMFPAIKAARLNPIDALRHE